MQFNVKAIAASAAIAAAAFAAAVAAPQAAHATVTTATAVTHIANDPDSGNGGAWAIDQIDRTLTVSVAADQSGVPMGSVRYLAHVADAGTFETLPGAHTPNQVIAGQHVAHVVSGTLTGSADYTLTAPSPSEVLDGAANAGVVANLNDGFHPASGAQTVPQWPAQAFVPELPAADVTPGNWSWTYTTQAGESWTYSSTNGHGNLVSDGNVTGLQYVPPALPRLSKGHAVKITGSREEIFFSLSGAPAWIHFLIAGPGKINGHEGWVPAAIGLNKGVYGGLEDGHTYLVFFTPVTGQGSETQIPGTHAGHVTFVS